MQLKHPSFIWSERVDPNELDGEEYGVLNEVECGRLDKERTICFLVGKVTPVCICDFHLQSSYWLCILNYQSVNNLFNLHCDIILCYCNIAGIISHIMKLHLSLALHESNTLTQVRPRLLDMETADVVSIYMVHNDEKHNEWYVFRLN